jgi:tRNA wybutosine-synthesizing protein 1
MAVSDIDIADLEQSGYRFLGEHKHSAVKVCHWTRKSLSNKGFCYKQQFYGIQSHRCLQLTPSLPFCDHRCLFCWRNINLTNPRWMGEIDDANDILDSAVSAHRRLLSGFGGNPEVEKKKLKEAQKPKHCAISLAGEPTIYPKINELIEECHRREMTTFLVTNGLHPDVLEDLVEPTQLYISLVAPDEKLYETICQPQVKDGWKRLNKSLELMPSFKCRKVIRLTLVKGLNLQNASGYARLIEKAEPDFIEAKAYMHVGFARARLKIESMPSLAEIKTIARELAREVGYNVVDESAPSRVVLLKN